MRLSTNGMKAGGCVAKRDNRLQEIDMKSNKIYYYDSERK